MLYFAKRALAAAWARFAPNAAVDLVGFGSVVYVLAAVWAGFASSGLVGVWTARCWISQNVFWLQPGHVLRPTQLSI